MLVSCPTWWQRQRETAGNTVVVVVVVDVGESWAVDCTVCGVVSLVEIPVSLSRTGEGSVAARQRSQSAWRD